MKKKEKTTASSLQAISKNQKVGNAQSANHQTVPGKIYSVRETGRFKRSLRRCRKRGYSENNLSKVIDFLAGSGQLPQKFLKHSLGGLFNRHLECHLSNDLLLVWEQDNDRQLITLVDIGTHSELFDKNRR